MEKHIKVGNLPTAKEFCNERLGFEEYGTNIPYFMIEFAKLHVEAALLTTEEEVEGGLSYVYPLENIK